MSKIAFDVEDIIGKKVVVRSNENEPLMVGTFIGKTGPHNMPQVKDDNGIVWTIGGIIMPYHKDLVETLNKLSPTEQYLLLGNMRNYSKIL